MGFIERLFYNLTEVHPLHTMVVHFPIGLTGAALFFMLLAVWRKNDELEFVAFANITLASLSTLVAGLTGMRDNLDIYDGSAPNVSWKIGLALLLLLLTALTSFARWRNPGLFHSRARGFYLSAYFISFALSAVLGFLGGVILYGF